MLQRDLEENLINPKSALDPSIKDPSGFFNFDKMEPFDQANMEPIIQPFMDNASLYNASVLESSDY